MHGNVWEWVEDVYQSSYEGAPTDGSAWLDDGADRVVRGGSWGSEARIARSAYRGRGGPGVRFGVLGFRCAGVQEPAGG
jgi:formylglycine-generating enzyme required for sulfatase activity